MSMPPKFVNWAPSIRASDSMGYSTRMMPSSRSFAAVLRLELLEFFGHGCQCLIPGNRYKFSFPTLADSLQRRFYPVGAIHPLDFTETTKADQRMTLVRPLIGLDFHQLSITHSALERTAARRNLAVIGERHLLFWIVCGSHRTQPSVNRRQRRACAESQSRPVLP